MSRKWNKWRTRWVLWLLLFFVIEMPAVFNNTDDDTLSEFVWDYITSHSFGWFFIAGLLAWLAYHFLIEKDDS